MADSNGAHVRPAHSQPQPQSTSYPSPHSYPSPSMPPSYAYQAPSQGQPSNEPYRASPNAPGGQIGPLNLPPIHTIDGQNHPQPPPHAGPPPYMGAQLPLPNVGAYYTQHQYGTSMPPQSASMSVPSLHNAHQPITGVRYQLPPQQTDQRMMSGGRHKKEIKRRTKTGCLTCRKRRIKCDEAHPICNNCRKSKRDCAGYDPIFKQQPGPAQIQPAPSSVPTASAPAPPPPAPAQYSHVPQGYAPASNASYPPPINSTAQPPHSSHEPYDFNAPIDPALGGPEHAQMPYEGQGSRPDVKGPFSNNGTYPGADRGFKVKKNNVEDLFAIGSVPPPQIPSTHTVPTDLTEVTEVFTKDYAGGLDRMLDTTWFTSKGLDALINDADALAAFSYLIGLFKTSQTDYNTIRQIPSFEAKTIWQLLSLCRKTQSSSTNGTSISSPEDLPLQEAKGRLDILEHLVTGHTRDVNPLLNLSYPSVEPSTDKHTETTFWKHLGTFITLRDDDSSSTKEIESVLADLRSLLLMQENRDVIYSIAIVRHVGTRMANEPVQQTYNNTEEDERNKLFIARKFLEEEAQNGMTQVIARVAGMAVRSWHVGH